MKRKRFLGLLLTLVMVMGLLPAAYAADAVSYIDYHWDGNALVKTMKTVTDYTEVTADTKSMSDGYYVVKDTVEIGVGNYKNIIVSGTVHLILSDNSLLTCPRSTLSGININEGNTLYIYAQSEGENMGAISLATAMTTTMGSENNQNAGNIIINGGNIDLHKHSGGRQTACIGGGEYGSGGNITINGGIITVQGGMDAAAIGGGHGGDSGNITINGGIINAKADKHGSAIGSVKYTSNGNITINGGIITAKGGLDSAGIGGSHNCEGGNITINGGTITANGGPNGAGIGGGLYGNGANLVITGGSINASGIGGGYQCNNQGTIKDGNGNDLSLHTFTLSGATDGTRITAISGFDYGIRDVQTLNTDKLYFWLSDAPESATFTAGDSHYFCRNDMTFRSAHDWNNGGCDFCGEECQHLEIDVCLCTTCGEYFHDGKILAHQDGTCTAEGYTSYLCNTCNQNYLEILPSLGGHKYTFTYDSVSHTGDCVNCDYILSGLHDYKNSCVCICGRVSNVNSHHNYSEVYTSPTCTEDGYYTYTCDDCDQSYTEAYGSRTGHSGGTATCTEKAICVDCGEPYGDEPVGHMEDGDDGTCLTPVECWVCHEIITPARDEHEWGEDDYCMHCYTGKPYKFYFMDGEVELFTADVEAHSYYSFRFTQNKDDYDFVGWDGDGDGVADYLGVDLPYNIYVEGEMTFNAVYEKVDYAFIRYYAVGYDSGVYEVYDIEKWPIGETINLDYDYAYWYTPLGWAIEPNGEKVYDYGEEITVTGTLDLYSAWEPFIITFDLGECASWVDEDGNPIPESIIEYGDFNTVPIRPGYIFQYFVGVDQYGSELIYEFNTDEETGERWLSIFASSKITLTAVWEECTEHNYVNGKCECGAVDNTIFAIPHFDKNTKTATVSIPEAGEYTVVFADYEDGRLANIETAVVTVQDATVLTASITKNFNLDKDDKVMLWQNMITLVPLCDAYILK